jgi:predicted nuclease of predicted toxin-antitoxin system
MKCLADESLDGPIVAWLRSQGHDVIWAAETWSGESDEFLVEKAYEEKRIVITSDRDFGELVFRRSARSLGIVLLRIRAKTSQSLLQAFQDHWNTISERVHGHFIVMRQGRIRIRPLQA